MTTRRNHYVPVWYQKGFVSAAPPRLYYLDLHPEPSEPRAGNGPALQNSAPKQCFWSQDLYTTLLFGAPNDEIERFLFGAIDNNGAVALRAVIERNARGIHSSFQDFFSRCEVRKGRDHARRIWPNEIRDLQELAPRQ